MRASRLGHIHKMTSTPATNEYSYDSNTKQIQKKLKLSTEGGLIRELAFSPDGKLLAGGDIVGMVRVWDLPESTLEQTVFAGATGLGIGDVSPDGRLCVVAKHNAEVTLLNTDDWTPLAAFPTGSIDSACQSNPPAR